MRTRLLAATAAVVLAMPLVSTSASALSEGKCDDSTSIQHKCDDSVSTQHKCDDSVSSEHKCEGGKG